MASSNYIALTDGYLILDTGQEGLGVLAVNRGFQLQIGDVTQWIIPAGTTFTGHGAGVIGVDNNGNLYWTAGGGSPSGPAGGDLSGTYPNPEVVGIRNISVPIPSGTNTVLTYNAGTLTWSVGLPGGADGFNSFLLMGG